MKTRTAWVLAASVAAILSGCVGPTAARKGGETLATNSDLPGKEMLAFFKPGEPTNFMDIPYDGYVVLEGQVDADRTVAANVVYSYPDRSRDPIAVELCAAVRIAPYSLGRRTKPRAIIYVVFFEKEMLRRKALVYAKQIDAGFGPNEVSSLGGFLKIASY